MTGRARVLFLALTLVNSFLASFTARPATHHPASSPLPVVTGNRLLDRAERAALAVLAADQRGSAHRAAPFYATPWLRDSYAWGMVPDDRGTLRSYARGELRYWLARQRSFGGWVTYQYSGWYDETPIMIAAVLDAYRLTGNKAMVRRALPRLQHAWHWLRTSYVAPRHGSGCLLWASLRPGGAYWATDWADQVARQGYTPQLEGLWYAATYAMASLETIMGHRRAVRGYARMASCIARDTNRLLWQVTAPAHRNARPLPRFGHYAARPRGRAYFELDANALLATLGLPNAPRQRRFLGVVAAHTHYLLGGDGGGPARVVYGDYAPRDYAPIHNWMGPGRYQSAYWPSVGGLLAIAAAKSDDTTLSLRVLLGLARGNTDAASAFHEWYQGNGTPRGAALYGWGARMYLLALYRAYLGVDDPTGSRDLAAPADLVLRAVPGPARGEMVRLGRRITIVNHGAGPFRYARLGKRILRSHRIPARLLYNGAVLQVWHGYEKATCLRLRSHGKPGAPRCQRVAHRG